MPGAVLWLSSRKDANADALGKACIGKSVGPEFGGMLWMSERVTAEYERELEALNGLCARGGPATTEQRRLITRRGGSESLFPK